jgi:hypothetical protein
VIEGSCHSLTNEIDKQNSDDRNDCQSEANRVRSKGRFQQDKKFFVRELI